MGEVHEARATLDTKLHFIAQAGAGQTIAVDYAPPLGDGNGYRPMEMILMSLAACAGQVVVSLLRRMNQEVASLEVRARGERREEHPTTFRQIALEFILSGSKLDPAMVEKAIALAGEKYSPVWAMLSAAVPVRPSFRIL